MDHALMEKWLPRLSSAYERYREIESQMGDPEVLAKPSSLAALGAERAALQNLAQGWQKILQAQDNIAQAAACLDDADMAAMAKEEIADAEKTIEILLDTLTREWVTSEDAGIGACVLEVRAASGGAEAALFAGELLQAYQAFAKQKNWSFEWFDISEGDMGGVRHAVAGVRGDGVWQALGYEGGVHCVKRVPATETQGRIHTSTCTVAVLPEAEQADTVLNRADIDEHVTTSQGPGGQNVNKVATAVHLIHRPTGIEVRMQESKSQQMNREKAWRLLAVRVHAHFQAEKDAKRAEERSSMIGSGARSERVRTYRWKEAVVVDHRLGQSFALQKVMAGQMTELSEALLAEDRARRLADM